MGQAVSSRKLGPGSGSQQADDGGSQGGVCTSWHWWQREGVPSPRVYGETKRLGVQVLAPPRDAFRGAAGTSGTRFLLAASPKAWAEGKGSPWRSVQPARDGDSV